LFQQNHKKLIRITEKDTVETIYEKLEIKTLTKKEFKNGTQY
jgi:hypothetical protein